MPHTDPREPQPSTDHEPQPSNDHDVQPSTDHRPQPSNDDEPEPQIMATPVPTGLLGPARMLLAAARRPRVAQIVRFGMVGVLGVVVNVGILHVLHNMLGWGFTRSSAIATEFAILHNYVWNELWTFHIRRLDFGRLLRYQASSLLAAAVTVAVATVANTLIDARLAQLVGVVSGAGLNYVVNVRWTWGPAASVPDLVE